MSLLPGAMKVSRQSAPDDVMPLKALPNQSAQNTAPEAGATSEMIRMSEQIRLATQKKGASLGWHWKLGWGFGLICSAIGAGYGYYVWHKSSPPVPPAAAISPLPPAQVTDFPVPLAMPSDPAPVQVVSPAPNAAEKRKVSQPKRPLPTTRTALLQTAGHDARTARGPARARSTPRLAIQRKAPVDRITPLLQDAWQAWRRGDLAAAEAGYRNVLAQDARNRDALLGLGAIAQRQGKDWQALEFFQQVLRLDPRDPVAQAALTAYVTPDNEGAEIRLRLLLAEQPRAAILHYALGNVYMEQSRWAEAQQAYFTALSLEPGNPQFSYNLAISLDHLGQHKLAANYYRQALQWDPAGLSGLNVAQTLRRLNELDELSMQQEQ